MPSLAKGLKLGRALRGMTQSELASALGRVMQAHGIDENGAVKSGYIGMIERGEKRGGLKIELAAPRALGMSSPAFHMLCLTPGDFGEGAVAAYEARLCAEILFGLITGATIPEPEVKQDRGVHVQPFPRTLIHLDDEDPLELWELKRKFQERGDEIDDQAALIAKVDALLDAAVSREKSRTRDQRWRGLNKLEARFGPGCTERQALTLIDDLIRHYDDHPNLRPLLEAVRELARDGTVSDRILRNIFPHDYDAEK